MDYIMVHFIIVIAEWVVHKLPVVRQLPVVLQPVALAQVEQLMQPMVEAEAEADIMEVAVDIIMEEAEAGVTGTLLRAIQMLLLHRELILETDK